MNLPHLEERKNVNLGLTRDIPFLNSVELPFCLYLPEAFLGFLHKINSETEFWSAVIILLQILKSKSYTQIFLFPFPN